MVPTTGLSGFNSTSSCVLLPCASPWRIVLKAVLSFPGKLIFNFSRRGGLQGSRIRIKRDRRSRGDKRRKLKIQRANKHPTATLSCHQPWCWKNSTPGRQKYFVCSSQARSSSGCVCCPPAAGLCWSQGASAELGSRGHHRHPPWFLPNFREGKHVLIPTFQQELLQTYKFFVEFRAYLKHKAQSLIEPWLAGGEEKPQK